MHNETNSCPAVVNFAVNISLACLLLVWKHHGCRKYYQVCVLAKKVFTVCKLVSFMHKILFYALKIILCNRSSCDLVGKSRSIKFKKILEFCETVCYTVQPWWAPAAFFSPLCVFVSLQIVIGMWAPCFFYIYYKDEWKRRLIRSINWFLGVMKNLKPYETD